MAGCVVASAAGAAARARPEGPRASTRVALVAGDKGVLEVDSDPPAAVWIDDGDTGKLTPARLDLAVGHHALTLVSPRDPTRRRTIGFAIDAGKTTKLTLHLTGWPK
jgi:hypothetical protein